MRTKGKIVSWNDEKGYGFVSPLAGGSQIFVHIKAFANRARRPVVGDVVTYSKSTDSRGRPCAEQATIAGIPKTATPRHSSGALPALMAVGFLLVVGGAVYVAEVPAQVFFIYLVVSLVTFAAYAFDKMAAEKEAWRTSERTLHILALVGGWPGALIAQNRLRHKSRRQPFRAVFWATVVLNCIVFAWLLTPAGTKALRFIVSAFA